MIAFLNINADAVIVYELLDWRGGDGPGARAVLVAVSGIGVGVPPCATTRGLPVKLVLRRLALLHSQHGNTTRNERPFPVSSS